MKLYLRYRFNVDEYVIRSSLIAFHAQDDRDCLIQNFWFWQSPLITHEPALSLPLLYVGMPMARWALKLHTFEIIGVLRIFLAPERTEPWCL